MRFNHLLVAPTGLRDALAQKIRREADHARAGRPARIVAKVNSLVDWPIIQELYEASQAGVQIDLIVRGTCCLRPGVPGLSERIRVVSIIDRFLEHARIYFFENGGAPEYYLASADWMPRNLDHRVEIAFPILDPAAPGRRSARPWTIQLNDTVKARLLQPDGTTIRGRGPGRGGDPLTGTDLPADRRRAARPEIRRARRPSAGASSICNTRQLLSVHGSPLSGVLRDLLLYAPRALCFLGPSKRSCASGSARRRIEVTRAATSRCGSLGERRRRARRGRDRALIRVLSCLPVAPAATPAAARQR